ncbi:hypothetical protein [Streptomyces sp. AC555_RSS877]|uniref:hypothetical protein n=1 Tax=Streptomyces sp. AC555_RSS877 TaxID=2823688 RepID=UPI001C260E95|nr:hypothetical protein [Streptomyces sp. AC555_RSS877]
MPRTAIAATQASRAGTVLPAATAGDVTNGNSVTNDGRVVLVVKNTGASSRTITFQTARTVDGLTAPVRSESIPAGETQIFGPFSPNDYGDTLGFNVDNAELTVNVIRV